MFEILFDLGATAVETFSAFSTWVFTEEFTVFGSTYTPIVLMLGGGLFAYAAFTLLKYAVDIAG